MEITPGRAMYSPDEELKPLRQPKTYQPEVVPSCSTLSINAAEFVPRYNIAPHNLQERLQKHQRLYIQKNYQQYQQPQQQTQQQYQSYSNSYGNQQHQQQHQQPQQYQQSSQNINTQMGAMSISSVQDRLLTGNNGGGRGGEGGGYNYQQQRGNGGHQQDYQQNHYRYNKNHNTHYQHQHQQQHHHSHQQNTYNNHSNQKQQHQKHQQQQYHQQNQQQQSSASAMAESANDMENIALDYLQGVIQCLNQNPGQFDTIATRFNYIFEGMENNHYVLSIAMEDIFDESIRSSNFRYMGAKLYSLLHTLNPSRDSLFHTLLKYKLEFHQQQVREYIQKKQECKVRETALFLAELYMQLRGEDSRNSLIAENIVFSLKELLSMEDNKDNIRCICLTLKLAGFDLSTDCPNDMRDIIIKLDAINCQNPGKYPMANNVISLQKNNWGRKPTGAASEAENSMPKHIEPLRDSDDPVFYGPDGHEITAEECEFLTNGAAATATSSENEEDDAVILIDDVDLDPEMDEETERDFKLFLKQANNKS